MVSGGQQKVVLQQRSGEQALCTDIIAVFFMEELCKLLLLLAVKVDDMLLRSDMGDNVHLASLRNAETTTTNDAACMMLCSMAAVMFN